MWKRIAEVAAGTALVWFALISFGIHVDATAILVIAGIIAIWAAADRNKKSKPQGKSGGGLLAALSVLASDSSKGSQRSGSSSQTTNYGAALAQERRWQAEQAQRDAMARQAQAQRDAMARYQNGK